MKGDEVTFAPDDLIANGLLRGKHFYGRPASVKLLLYEILRIRNPVRISLTAPVPSPRVSKYLFETLFLTLSQLALLQDASLRGGSDSIVELFWSAMSYSRVDYWVETRGLTAVWLYCVWGAVTLLAGYNAVLGALISYGAEVRPAVISLCNLLSWVLCTVLQSPSAVVLFLSISPLFTDSKISLPTTSSTAFLYSSITALISLFVLIILTVLCIMHELADCVVEHQRSISYFYAKAGVELRILELAVVHFSAFSYVFVSFWHPILHQCVMAGMWLVVAVLQFLRFPQYRIMCTVAELIKSAIPAWASACILITKLTGVTITHVFLITCVSAPLILLLSAILHRYQQISIRSSAHSKRFSHALYRIEHGFRYYVEVCLSPAVTGSQRLAYARDVLKRFFLARNARRESVAQILIWEIPFDLLVLEDERLARVRLGLLSESKTSLFTSYFTYRLCKELTAWNDLDEVNFLKMQVMLSDVKRTDEAVSKELNDFWTELMATEPRAERILHLSSSVHNDAREAREQYKVLTNMFPKQAKPAKLFAGFLSEVLNLKEKSVRYSVKSSVLEDADRRLSIHQDNDSLPHYSDPGCCLILAYANGPQTGIIINCNENAQNALSYDNVSLIGHHFADLIPPVFQRMHRKHLRKYIFQATEPIIKHPVLIYLYTAKNYIVECQSALTVTAVGPQSVLIIAFKVSRQRKEVAIIGSDGVVLAHSSAFAQMLGEKDRIVGRLLQDVNAQIYELKLRKLHFKSFRLDSPIRGFVVFACSQIGTVCIDLVFWFRLEHDVFQWLRGFRQSYAANTMKPRLKDSASEPFQRSLAHERQMSIITNLNDPAKLNVKFQEEPEVYSYAMLSYVSHDALTVSRISGADEPSSGASFNASSFASNLSTDAEFARSELGAKFIVRVKRLFRVLHWLILFTFALSTIGNILTADYLVTTIQNGIDRSDVDLLVLMRIAIVHVYEEAREETAVLMPFQGAKSHLLEEVTELGEMVETLRKKVESDDSGEFSPLFGSHSTLTWELQDSEVVLVTHTLLDALHNLVANSLKIVASDPSGAASYYVARNALSETYHNLNITLTDLIESNQRFLMEKMAQMYPCVIALLAAFVGMCALIGPMLARIQRCAEAPLKALQGFPVSLYIEERAKALDRLSSIHGLDLEPTNDHISKRPRTPAFFRVWLRSAVVLLAFFVLTSAFYLAVYFTAIESVTKIVAHGSEEVALVGRMVSAAIETWLWVLESHTFRQNSSISILSGNTVTVTPEWQMRLASAERQFVQEKLVLRMRDADFEVPNDTVHIYFDNFQCNCPYFIFGLLPGLSNMDSDLWALLEEPAEQLSTSILTCMESIHTALPALIRDLEKNDIEENRKLQVYMILAILTFIVLSGVVLLGALTREVKVAHKSIRRIWEILALIPVSSYLSPVQPTPDDRKNSANTETLKTTLAQ